MKPCRVLIVEDQHVPALAFRQIIDAAPDLVVCDVVKCVQEIIPAIEEYSPDVILMDIWLPEYGGDPVDYGDPAHQRGIAAGRKLKADRPETGVLYTSALPGEETFRLISKGDHQGLGFVSKNASSEELLFALRRVAEGGRHWDAETTERVLFPPSSLCQVLREQVFSEREKDVLRLIATGVSRAQAANKLSISVGVLDKHLASIREKLGDRQVNIGDSKEYSFVHLTHLAIRLKLVSPLSVESGQHHSC